MPDVHVPKLEMHGGSHSILKILLEVALRIFFIAAW